MWKYNYAVPKEKQVRLIVYTDCANEADDQYALAHALMTQKVDVVGIIAAHFDATTHEGWSRRKPGTTAKASFDEIVTVLDKMKLSGQYKIAMGAESALIDEKTPIFSEAAQMIIDEAQKEDNRPLYIGCQGSVTDLASAILICPEICDKATVIWIGGGDYPKGGFEFNLMQDINAANVLFSSKMPLWQVPMCVYKTFAVSLAELQYKVAPYGEIGKYLFENLVRLNDELSFLQEWPHGELWGLGDQGVMAALMQEVQRDDNYEVIRAPKINISDMTYDLDTDNREIRVFKYMDTRLALEDFFCKLAINYK